MGRLIMRVLLRYITDKYGKRGRRIFLGGTVALFGALFLLTAVVQPGGNLVAGIFGTILLLPGLAMLVAGLRTPPSHVPGHQPPVYGQLPYSQQHYYGSPSYPPYGQPQSPVYGRPPMYGQPPYPQQYYGQPPAYGQPPYPQQHYGPPYPQQ